MGSGNGGGGGFWFLTAGQKGAILGLASILAAIAVIWSSGEKVAEALPYATKAELKQIAGEVIMLKKDNLRRAIITNQQLRYDNLREQRIYEEQGKAPPIELLQDQENLQEERKLLNREMEQLEAQ